MRASVLSLVRSVLWAAGVLFAGTVVAKYSLERFEAAASTAVTGVVAGVGAAIDEATKPAWFPLALAVGGVIAILLLVED